MQEFLPGSEAGRGRLLTRKGLCCTPVSHAHSGRKTKSQEGTPPTPGAARGPRPAPTVRGEDVAEHGLELLRGRQLPQDLSQALGGCAKVRRETGEQPTLVEELSHRQWEDLHQDGMNGSAGYQLRRKMRREAQVSFLELPGQNHHSNRLQQQRAWQHSPMPELGLSLDF